MLKLNYTRIKCDAIHFLISFIPIIIQKAQEQSNGEYKSKTMKTFSKILTVAVLTVISFGASAQVSEKEAAKKQVQRIPATPASELKNESTPAPTTVPSTVVPSPSIPVKSEKTKKTENQTVPAENKVKAIGNGKK